MTNNGDYHDHGLYDMMLLSFKGIIFKSTYSNLVSSCVNDEKVSDEKVTMRKCYGSYNVTKK